MKEKFYIAKKIIHKQAIPLLLFSVLVLIVFVSVFGGRNAYASEQIAKVQCDVYVVNAEKQLVTSNLQFVSNLDSAVIELDDIDVEMDKHSKLEINYSVENITDRDFNFVLKLNEDEIENFKIEYYINNEFAGDLSNFTCVVEAFNTMDVKVELFVNDTLLDAYLSGSLELNFEFVGESSGN